jgi:hypothetical protein
MRAAFILRYTSSHWYHAAGQALPLNDALWRFGGLRA